MPLDYQAFREQTRVSYHRYARARLGESSSAARDAVEAAFDDLAVIWAEALSSASLAALAWHLLDRAVTARTPAPARAPADARLLHHRLGFSVEVTADLMGTDVVVVQALLSDRKVGRGCCACPACR